jgi:hypothetical protein
LGWSCNRWRPPATCHRSPFAETLCNEIDGNSSSSWCLSA